MTVRSSQNHSDRQSVALCEHRSFLTGFGAVCGVKTDGVVKGLGDDVLEAGEDPGGDPLVTAGSQRCGRDPIIGVLGVSAAQDETSDELVEDDPVGHTRSVTSEWMAIDGYGQECFELAPEGVDD